MQFVASLGWGAASSFLGVYVISSDGLGTDSALFVGVILATRSLLSAALQLVFGPLADRANRLVLVVIGLGLLVAWNISKTIRRGISRAVEVTQDVAQGRLDRAVAAADDSGGQEEGGEEGESHGDT